MRRFGAGAAFVATTLLSGTAAVACGDKLLAVGRGVRFQRGYAAHEANLVIYFAGAEGRAALNNAKLQNVLSRAGHKLQIVASGSQLDEALKSGKVDVVLVDFGDLAGIAEELRSAPSKPVIVPVLFKPSKSELARAQKEYKFALKVPAGDFEYLTAIDEAMRLRLKNGAKS